MSVTIGQGPNGVLHDCSMSVTIGQSPYPGFIENVCGRWQGSNVKQEEVF